MAKKRNLNLFKFDNFSPIIEKQMTENGDFMPICPSCREHHTNYIVNMDHDRKEICKWKNIGSPCIVNYNLV